MYDQFRKQPFLMQVVIVMIALIVSWVVLQFVLGLLRTLIPVAILAAIIVGAIWLFEQVRD